MPSRSDAIDRLTKLLPLLGSDKGGEVVATAAAIGRTLKSCGMDWHDLAAALTEKPKPSVVRQPNTAAASERKARKAARDYARTQDDERAARESRERAQKRQAQEEAYHAAATERWWRSMAADLLASTYPWNEWEQKFLRSMRISPSLSEKQDAVMKKLAKKAA